MPEKKGERSMLEVKESLEIGSGSLISGSQLVGLFHRVFNPVIELSGDLFSETLYRVSSTHEPLATSQRVDSAPGSYGDVSKVNLPSYSRESLDEIQKYRLVHNREAEGIYKVVKEISREGGIYVITDMINPVFIADIKKPELWAVDQIDIREYKGLGAFRFLPDLSETKKKITLETTVSKRAKGEREKLTKALFLNFHRQVKRKYQDKGATLIEE